MPNWTDNVLTVTGTGDGNYNARGAWKDFGAQTKEVLDHGGTMLEHYIPKDPRVGKKVKMAQGFTFSAFATMEEDGFDGYQWCLDNWGCKWPENDCELDIRERSIRMSFVTPWDAPIEGLLRISKLFHLAKFRLISDYEGCDDIIRRKFQAGELVSTEWVKGGPA
jgi:hypothetical protein